MASLTDQLSSPTAGKGVIATQVERPSFIAGLSKLVSGVDQAVSGVQAQRAKDASSRRQADADARAEGLRTALNTAETSVFSAFEDSPAQAMDLRTETSSVWDSVVSAAATDLGSTKKAVDQGRVPQASYSLQLERVQKDLFHQFPEFTHEIAQYMQGRGFDSYLFRERKADAKMAAEILDSERVVFTANLKTATDAGIPLNRDNPEETAMVGARLSAANAAREQANREYELARQREQDGNANAKHDMEIAQYNGVAAITQEAIIKVGSIVPTFANLLAAAGDDTAKQAQLNEVVSMIPGVFASYKTAGGAQIKDPKARKAFEDQLDVIQASVVDMYSGPLSQVKVNKQTVENMSNTYAIEFAKMMPIYSKLKSNLGAAAVNAVFGGTPPLPPEMQTALAHEFAGLRTADAEEGRVILNNMTQIIKGDRRLKDMSEKDARKQMPLLTRTAIAAAQDINANGGDTVTFMSFANSYSNLLNAAIEIQPVGSDTNSVLSASSIVGSKDSRKALEAGLKEDPERFKPIIDASRATAVNLMEASRGLPVKQDRTTFYDVGYDAKSGKYFSKPDVKKYDAYIKSQGVAPPGIPWAKLSEIAVPTDVTKKVDALNLNLRHLVETAKYDEDVPKTTTPLQLASHYALGSPLVRTDSAGKPTTKSADEQFTESVTAFKTELQSFPAAVVADPNMSFKGASISPGDAVSRLENYQVPRHIAAGIVGNLMAESGLKTGAVGDSGKALSLAQWHPDRQEAAREQGYNLSDPNDAIDFVLHELKTTETKAYQKLKEAKTSEEAARIFALYFLRPKGAETGSADNIPSIGKRVKYAQGLG